VGEPQARREKCKHTYQRKRKTAAYRRRYSHIQRAPSCDEPRPAVNEQDAPSGRRTRSKQQRERRKELAMSFHIAFICSSIASIPNGALQASGSLIGGRALKILARNYHNSFHSELHPDCLSMLVAASRELSALYSTFEDLCSTTGDCGKGCGSCGSRWERVGPDRQAPSGRSVDSHVG
jgi:hypothetical protein